LPLGGLWTVSFVQVHDSERGAHQQRGPWNHAHKCAGLREVHTHCQRAPPGRYRRRCAAYLPDYPEVCFVSLVLAGCKILEDAAVGFFHGKSFSQSIADLGGGTLKGILTLTVLMFVMFIPFFGFGELQRVLGEGKLAQLFFRPRDVSAPAKPRLV